MRTFIPISQFWFPTSKSPNIFPMSNNQNPSSPTLLFHNKLRFNLDFISWFASIFKIHFQVRIFCGFEFKVFLFSRIFANLLHVNNFLVLFFYSLQPLESIFNIPLSQVFAALNLRFLFSLERLQFYYLLGFKLVLFPNFFQISKINF